MEDQGMFSLINIFKAFAGFVIPLPWSNDDWKVAEGKLIVSQDGLKKVGKPGAAVYMAGNQLPRPVLRIKTNEGNFRAYAAPAPTMAENLITCRRKICFAAAVSIIPPLI